MRLVKEVRTCDLQVGDSIEWDSGRRLVVHLANTGRPAVFGNGHEWHISLRAADGGLVEMAAADDDYWVRV